MVENKKTTSGIIVGKKEIDSFDYVQHSHEYLGPFGIPAFQVAIPYKKQLYKVNLAGGTVIEVETQEQFKIGDLVRVKKGKYPFELRETYQIYLFKQAS